jgi:hypothetical protein
MDWPKGLLGAVFEGLAFIEGWAILAAFGT